MTKETSDRKRGNAGGVKGTLKVEMPPVPEGTGKYVNQVMASHTENEFMLDFWHVYPVTASQGAATFQFRAILSPSFIKKVQRAFEKNIAMYEQSFGVLPEPSETA